jgi:aminopeptidase N
MLANCDCAARQEVLDDFYQKWSADTLVVNKWLAVQAMSRLPGTLQRVRELTAHPAFELRNPNKVRALLSTFCNGNPAQFHAADGEGYAFLTDRIIELDPLNPQIAARLLTPMTRWQRYDSTRQQLMRDELQRILAQQDLSRDVYEICSKSLKSDPDPGK